MAEHARPARPSDFAAPEIDGNAAFVFDRLLPSVEAVFLPDLFGGLRVVGYVGKPSATKWTWRRADTAEFIYGGSRFATRHAALDRLRASLAARPLGTPHVPAEASR